MSQALASVDIPEGGRSFGVNLWEFARHFPGRLRDTHFWVIQFLVLATTAFHYSLEARLGADISSIHHIPVTLYLIAVVYAGIHYRLEGGILTALLAVVLTIPSIAIWHRESLMWVGEIVQLMVAVGVGAVVAWRVELEADHRRRAEGTSQRLALLHDVSMAVSQTLELERVLDDTLARVAKALESDRAWTSVWDGPEGRPTLLAQAGEPICDNEPRSRLVWETSSCRIQLTGAPAVLDNRAVAVPLTADGKLVGAFGVACRNGKVYTSDDVELLAAMANHVAVAMDNARLYRDERQMQEALRHYVGQITRAQEEERKRIARELHDDAVQNLVLLCRQLDFVLDAGGGRSKDRQERFTELRALAESTLQSMRRFSRDLRPSVLDDLGLVPAIEWLTSDLARRSGTATSLEVSGEVRRLGTEAELLLFRIVQEALRNVEKHSGAPRVNVAVTFDDGEVAVTIADDGCGFRIGPVKDETYTGGLGLLGMQERANLLGASFDIDSRPNEGTQIKVVAPDS